MNLALPALIFSSIVPAFTPANAFAIGPLALLATMYILTGLLCGLVIREVCYVPRNFWQGIVVASGLSNWSSLRAYPSGPNDMSLTLGSSYRRRDFNHSVESIRPRNGYCL